MEVHGSVEALKRAISQDFAAKIREVNREKRAQLKELREMAKREMAAVEETLKREMDSRVAEARATVLNEQRAAAKRAFEEARERMICEVIEAAKQRFPRFLRSSQYLAFVKQRAPSNAKVLGNPFFKRHFRGLKPVKALQGLRFEKENVVYDFTMEGLFDARASAIRSRVIKALW